MRREQAFKLLNTVVDDEYISRNIERGVYNYTIYTSRKRLQLCSWESQEFVDIYLNKLKQIYVNLKSDSYIRNEYLIRKVKEKEVLPHEIVFLQSSELFPEKWEKYIKEKQQRDALLSEIDYGIATTQFYCKKCKGNKTTYYTMQTRSADEAETVFITCLTCGRRWRK